MFSNIQINIQLLSNLKPSTTTTLQPKTPQHNKIKKINKVQHFFKVLRIHTLRKFFSKNANKSDGKGRQVSPPPKTRAKVMAKHQAFAWCSALDTFIDDK